MVFKAQTYYVVFGKFIYNFPDYMRIMELINEQTSGDNMDMVMRATGNRIIAVPKERDVLPCLPIL